MEKFRFKSAEEIHEEEIEQRLIERDEQGDPLGGIVYEEVVEGQSQQTKRLLHFSNPYDKQSEVITLETTISEAEFKRIRESFIPIQEFFQMMVILADTYNMRQMVLLEGPSALGKTYAVRKFVELLYGEGLEPFNFMCNGQSDVSDLMARWVPRTNNQEQLAKWQRYLDTPDGEEQLAAIAQEVEGRSSLSDEQKTALITARMKEVARVVGLDGDTQWQLQYGAVPKAMTATLDEQGHFSFDDTNGGGFPLLIDEVGMAEPAVVNSLLKLRGDAGRITSGIQLWEDAGRRIKSGPGFWVVFCTNPPEDYDNRKEIDPALARSIRWERLPEISQDSLRQVARYFSLGKADNKRPERIERTLLDFTKHPKIAELVGQVVADFHQEMDGVYRKGESSGSSRRQKFVLTLDHIAKAVDSVRANQVRSQETGYWDATLTLQRALKKHYINALADPKKREQAESTLREILVGDTGKIRQPNGKVETIKAVLDYLVEECGLTQEEKERIKQEQWQAEVATQREQVQHSIDDLSSNERLPRHVRSVLGGVKAVSSIP